MSFPVDPVVLPFLPQLPNGPEVGKDEPTDIVIAGSGSGSGNQRWPFPMVKVTFSWDVLTDPDTIALEQFLTARSNIRGWLFWDDSDNTATADPVGAVGASVFTPLNGDGSNRSFQLLRKYGDAYAVRYRKITRPLTGGLSVPELIPAPDDITVYTDSGSGPMLAASSTYSIANTTGVLTFGLGHAPPSGAVITWTGHHLVPMRLKDPFVPKILTGPNRAISGLQAVEVAE